MENSQLDGPPTTRISLQSRPSDYHSIPITNQQQTATSSSPEIDGTPKKDKEGASFLSGVLNLTNTLLGGGIAFVALPLATKEIGVPAIICLLVCSGFVNAFTCNLLVKASNLTGHDTYFKLAGTLGYWKHGEFWWFVVFGVWCFVFCGVLPEGVVPFFC